MLTILMQPTDGNMWKQQEEAVRHSALLLIIVYYLAEYRLLVM